MHVASDEHVPSIAPTGTGDKSSTALIVGSAHETAKEASEDMRVTTAPDDEDLDDIVQRNILSDASADKPSDSHSMGT